MLKDRYGPWALLVGGSEGVGAAMARRLADAGVNLVLVARKPGPLAEVATQARARGVDVRSLTADISRPVEALATIRAVTDGLEVGLLVYMAGANLGRGEFVDLPMDMVRAVIAMNVIGQTEFTHHYGGRMTARGRGGIILVGSLAGHVGSPLIAPYSAAKAYSRIFSEAVWFELRRHGVDLLHLVLGFTATPAMERLGYDLATGADPEAVAEEGLAHIADGPVWIAGGPANEAEAVRRASGMPRAEAVGRVVLPPRK